MSTARRESSCKAFALFGQAPSGPSPRRIPTAAHADTDGDGISRVGNKGWGSHHLQGSQQLFGVEFAEDFATIKRGQRKVSVKAQHTQRSLVKSPAAALWHLLTRMVPH